MTTTKDKVRSTENENPQSATAAGPAATRPGEKAVPEKRDRSEGPPLANAEDAAKSNVS